MSEIKDKESWHGHTNAEVENYIKNRLDNSAGCKKILYAELKELRDNNKGKNDAGDDDDDDAGDDVDDDADDDNDD